MKKNIPILVISISLAFLTSCSNANSEEKSPEIWNPADYPSAYNCDTLESTISLGQNDPSEASQDNPSMLWYNYWCQ